MSHWGDTKVIVSLVAAAVLLVAFGMIEVRSRYALMPIRVLRSRDRSGAYLVSLCIGTALFGMFFFLTLFVQNVLGYSPLRTGVAYLPLAGMILVATAAASQLVSRISARPLIIAGSAAGADPDEKPHAGMYHGQRDQRSFLLQGGGNPGQP